MDIMGPGDEARRQLLIQTLAAGTLGTALFSRAAAADVQGGRPRRLPPEQSVYRVTGRVLVDGVAVAADTRIAPDATIETASNSEIVFVVGDNAMLVRGDSRIALEAGTGAGQTLLAGVRVVRGKLLSVFPTGQPRQLNMPTASVRITGTGVYVEADTEQAYFCTCYGVSEVVAVGDPLSRTTVATTHHDRPLYIVARASSGERIRPAPFVNHTDQELMLIETLVGRTPPFNFPGTQYQTPRSGRIYR